MSRDWNRKETPAQAFIRKMPPKDAVVIDRQTGEEHDVLSQGAYCFFYRQYATRYENRFV